MLVVGPRIQGAPALSTIFEHVQSRSTNEKGKSMTQCHHLRVWRHGQRDRELLTAGGATVDHIGSADPPGPVNGDIVILAVYHTAFKDIVENTATSWPARSSSTSRTRWTLRPLTHWSRLPHSSSAADLADALPSSRVLKAFNTNFAPTLSAKKRRPEQDHCSRRR